MNKAIRISRIILGGAICGSFFGILCGAVAGTVYGVSREDVSLGLDGALFGGVLLALSGAFYGAVLGLTEDHAVTEDGQARSDHPVGGRGSRDRRRGPRTEWIRVLEDQYLGH